MSERPYAYDSSMAVVPPDILDMHNDVLAFPFVGSVRMPGGFWNVEFPGTPLCCAVMSMLPLWPAAMHRAAAREPAVRAVGEMIYKRAVSQLEIAEAGTCKG